MIDSLVDYLSVYSMLFCLLPASAGFLLGWRFDPEDGGDMLPRNIALFPNYTALQGRSPYSSHLTSNATQ
jgi:hypothetical protein